MNIFNFEFKRNLTNTIIWIVAIIMIGLFYTAMGPVFLDQSDLLHDFMLGMGEDFLKGLGINFDTFFTPVGFYAYIGGFIGLALGIQATIYGIKAFVIEKNNHSVEFLYTKPKSRTKLFFAKFCANGSLLFITQVFVISSLYVFTDLINDVDYDHSLMLGLLITYIPLQFLFYTLGTLIGVSANRLKNVVSVSLMIGFVMFFMNMLGGIIEIKVFDYLSFFNYYNLGDISLTGEYDPNFVALSLGLIGLFSICSLIIYNKKDLKVI